LRGTTQVALRDGFPSASILGWQSSRQPTDQPCMARGPAVPAALDPVRGMTGRSRGRPNRHPGARETAAIGLEIVMANVMELRVALTVEDFEQALAFYRDVLGLEQIADWSSGTGRVVALDAGRATLELFDNA
jgi:hypothetical protein